MQDGAGQAQEDPLETGQGRRRCLAGQGGVHREMQPGSQDQVVSTSSIASGFCPCALQLCPLWLMTFYRHSTNKNDQEGRQTCRACAVSPDQRDPWGALLLCAINRRFLRPSSHLAAPPAAGRFAELGWAEAGKASWDTASLPGIPAYQPQLKYSGFHTTAGSQRSAQRPHALCRTPENQCSIPRLAIK